MSNVIVFETKEVEVDGVKRELKECNVGQLAHIMPKLTPLADEFFVMQKANLEMPQIVAKMLGKHTMNMVDAISIASGMKKDYVMSLSTGGLETLYKGLMEVNKDLVDKLFGDAGAEAEEGGKSQAKG